MTFQERSDQLRDQWGFTCTCSVCKPPPEAVEASDRRLKQMQQLEEQLTNLNQHRNASIQAAHELIALYEEERIHGPIAKAYEYAALEYAYAGQKWMVKRYAQMAVEAGKLWRGPLDPGVKKMEALLEDPENHPRWGTHRS